MFDEFWSLYPKKVGKQAAFNAWKKIKLSPDLTSKILNAVKAQREWDQWKRDNGQYIPNPANFIVRVGTPAAALVEACGGISAEDVLVKAGGPMMGFPQTTLYTPIMKGSNGIITVDSDPAEPQPCIKCGRCVDVCPMELKPLHFPKFLDEPQKLKELNIMDCMECRCCEYICPSKIPLLYSIRAGKAAVRGMK